MPSEMPRSSMQGDMIRMPLPGGGFTVYPYKFGYDAMHGGKYSLFVSKGTTEDDASLLMATMPTGARVILAGSFDKLVSVLLGIKWKEERVGTSEGPMYRKIAPSLTALEEMIATLKNKTSVIEE